MNRAFKATGFAACLLAVLLASGGHWAVLQSIAWAGMLIDYSRTDSLAGAVSKTFDGKHPCPLCRKIQEGRKQEPRTPPVLRWEKLPELCLEARHETGPCPPLRDCHSPGFVPTLHSDFVLPPPKPPPRAA
jgi:hypothetical protein